MLDSLRVCWIQWTCFQQALIASPLLCRYSQYQMQTRHCLSKRSRKIPLPRFINFKKHRVVRLIEKSFDRTGVVGKK
jgi:hypothetical protein